MKNLKRKDDPVEILRRFASFVNRFNNIAINHSSIVGKILQIFLIKVVYRYMRRSIKNSLKKDVEFACYHHTHAIDVLTRFVVAILGWTDSDIDNLDKLIKESFPDPQSFKLIFTNDPTDKYTLINYKAIAQGVSAAEEFYKGQFVKMTVSLDIKSVQCTLEIEIKDLDKDGYPKVTPVQVKTLKFSSSGELSNPNYILDSKLYKSDLRDYCFSMIYIISPLCKMIENVTQCKFVTIDPSSDAAKTQD